ncbi:histidine kinase [Pseudonocardia hierapolitana]|uniref:ATP-dependent DNA ligase n=1 Tax=Pseudonocardia hierapolitana TaxID=1128676 RepID=UPI0011BDDA7C|nr:histidine kinase [Pseudonocardia hierapolitana]
MTERATRRGVPALVPPMQPGTVTGDPPTGPDWVVEVAWTGHRCIAYVEPGRRVRLLSGAANSMSAAYPELAEPLLRRSPSGGMVLDGTLVARGEEHAVRPRLIARRTARHRPSEATIRRIPVDFQVADLLWLDGHSTTDLPYADRRALLDALGLTSPPVWATSPLPATEIDTMLAIAEQKGADGLHARHLRGRYHPGGRSRFWLRVPVTRTRQVLVGGWTPADPTRPETVGTLLLGAPVADTPGALHYVGRVGLSLGERRRLADALAEHEQNTTPFVDAVPAAAARHARWARPELVGLAEFSGWIGGGRMRRPFWRGLLEPADVREDGWARPPEPAPAVLDPAVLDSAVPAEPAAEPVADPVPEEQPGPIEPPAQPEQAGAAGEARRLEQHFVYNSLNTIAALIRTDPGRARDLLIGFADLSRAVDRVGGSTLGDELAAVHGYLQLEQARFGRRLRVAVDVAPTLHLIPVIPMQILAAVRDAVQHDIEPQPEGGLLTLAARPVEGGCEVRVTGGAAAARTIRLPS